MGPNETNREPRPPQPEDVVIPVAYVVFEIIGTCGRPCLFQL
jgi:hypothetical protein